MKFHLDHTFDAALETVETAMVDPEFLEGTRLPDVGPPEVLSREEDGDTVTLRAELREKDVLIAVGDTGPGISREELPTIFEAYRTIERPGKGGGTGLGLYITKGIVERHGGRIWVDSEAGTGSTFFFTLPRA